MSEATHFYKLEEVCIQVGLERSQMVAFITRQWISPAVSGADAESVQFDEEDLARARLILDLTQKMGINDEGVPVVLHLLDQLHCLQAEVRRRHGG